jgi:lysophospholipase L1-like esterase
MKSATPGPNSLLRAVVFRAGLILTGVLVSLLGAELAYRAVLAIQFQKETAKPTYFVANGSLYTYDQSVGYRYAPNQAVLFVHIKNGYPESYETVRVNRYGNIGPAPENWRTAAVRILILGDSFTANPRMEGRNWPDFLAAKLHAKYGYHAEITNMGRDGYGVLQMYDLAWSAIRRMQPSLTIIAVIMEDLTRARTWRTLTTIDDEPRLLISCAADPDPDLELAADKDVVNPSVSLAWFRSMQAEHQPEDPLLRDLNEQYRRLERQNRGVNLTALNTSFLLDRIRYGDPYHRRYKPARNPNHGYWDFMEDRGFKQTADKIAAFRVPVLVILLPTYEEIMEKGYRGSDRQIALLESLQKNCGGYFTALLEPLTSTGEDPKSYFLLPDDRHPSPRGAEAYAEAIADLFEGVRFGGDTEDTSQTQGR